jgi:hypothetical protein
MKIFGMAAAAVTAALTLAAASAAAAPAASAAPGRAASAPRPGQWERVTANGLGNTADIGLVRGEDGVLHVVWVSAAGTSLLDTPIAADGAVQRAVTIAAHFVSVSFPDATATPSGLDAFWNGAATDSSSTWGTYEATRPLHGGSWHVSGPATPINFDWGAGMAATTGADGKPWVAFVATGGIAVRHYGHPEQLLKVSGCCRYETGIGTDGKSGTTWVTYNSNASPASGIYARELTQSGTPAGPAARAPGSKLTHTLLQRMTAVGRGKGRSGVYITYLTGYPFATAVRIYRLGSKSAMTVERLGSESNVGLSMLTADPAGGLWVAWASTINGQAALWVRRSDSAVQKFGPVEKVRLPAGTEDVWRVYLSATSSHLDVVALLTVGTKIAYWHTEVLPSK